MEADDRAAAAGGEEIGERGEDLLELHELGVDRDAERLERARRGVDLRLALLRERDRIGAELRELGRGAELIGLGRVLDQPGDPLRVALLAVLEEDLGEVGRVGGPDQLERRLAVGRIHPHVERAVLHEGEATLGQVELGRRDTQIEQQAIELAIAEKLRDFAELRVVKLDVSELLASCPERQRIAIDAY